MALDAKSPSRVVEQNGHVLSSMRSMAAQAGNDLIVPYIYYTLPIGMAELRMLLMAFFTEVD